VALTSGVDGQKISSQWPWVPQARRSRPVVVACSSRPWVRSCSSIPHVDAGVGAGKFCAPHAACWYSLIKPRNRARRRMLLRTRPLHEGTARFLRHRRSQQQPALLAAEDQYLTLAGPGADQQPIQRLTLTTPAEQLTPRTAARHDHHRAAWELPDTGQLGPLPSCTHVRWPDSVPTAPERQMRRRRAALQLAMSLRCVEHGQRAVDCSKPVEATGRASQNR
jgi:hypothetical protein